MRTIRIHVSNSSLLQLLRGLQARVGVAMDLFSYLTFHDTQVHLSALLEARHYDRQSVIRRYECTRLLHARRNGRMSCQAVVRIMGWHSSF